MDNRQSTIMDSTGGVLDNDFDQISDAEKRLYEFLGVDSEAEELGDTEEYIPSCYKPLRF